MFVLQIPVEIYKQWINSLEFDSGKACGMPYDVSTEEALKYPEVSTRFNRFEKFPINSLISTGFR